MGEDQEQRRCAATIMVAGTRFQCGYADPHPPTSMPDVHAVNVVVADAEGGAHHGLLEWPLTAPRAGQAQVLSELGRDE